MSESINFAAEFLADLQAGDRTAFAELVEKTSGSIFNLGLRMLGNEQDAEDMLQETYLKAYKALPGFENRSSVNTWLYRIAVNEALLQLRKRKNFSETDDLRAAEDDDQELEIIDWCCLPESEFISEETVRKLSEAALQLTPSLRMVFLLRDVQGFTTSETADVLQINEDAVKTRLVRARAKLRNELSDYFGERLKGYQKNA